MTGGDVLARVLGIPAKNVVTLDLFRFEELHRFEVLRKMYVAKFSPG
jgi:hypothetical protein